MALNVVLVPQPQSSSCIGVSWSAAEGAVGYDVFVAKRRLAFDELEAAQLAGGAADAQVVRLPPTSTQLVDDVTPEGERRFYGAVAVMADGTSKSARFKAMPLETEMAANATLLSEAKPSPKRAPPPPPQAETKAVAPVARGIEDEMPTSEQAAVDPTRGAGASSHSNDRSSSVSAGRSEPGGRSPTASPASGGGEVPHSKTSPTACRRAVGERSPTWTSGAGGAGLSPRRAAPAAGVGVWA